MRSAKNTRSRCQKKSATRNIESTSAAKAGVEVVEAMDVTGAAVAEEGAMAVEAETGAAVAKGLVGVAATGETPALVIEAAALVAEAKVVEAMDVTGATTTPGTVAAVVDTPARGAQEVAVVQRAVEDTGATTVERIVAALAPDMAEIGVKAAVAIAAVPVGADTVVVTGEEEAMDVTGARAAAVATLAALAALAVAALAAQRASREGTESALENDGIRWISVAGEKHAATLNLVPGNNVYGEKLVKYDGEEYRLWDPFRSKLAGSLKKGLKKMPIQNGTKVLYLGASTGTTVSHVSDIVGNSGIVFAVEPATRVARDLIENVASKRRNVVPVLEDARRPQSYFSVFGKVDVVYCDIAQPDQTDIAITNCNAYLKPGGVMLLLVKTQSIDVTRDPNAVIAQEAKKLEKAGFAIEQILKLEPFDKDHGMIYCFK